MELKYFILLVIMAGILSWALFLYDRIKFYRTQRKHLFDRIADLGKMIDHKDRFITSQKNSIVLLDRDNALLKDENVVAKKLFDHIHKNYPSIYNSSKNALINQAKREDVSRGTMSKGST